MFSLSTLVLTSLVALLTGCALGATILRVVSPQQQLNRDLEHRLQQAETSLSDYQSEVKEHFEQTSKLVNNLTASYREIHEYLANSALRLSTADISRQFIESGMQKLTGDNFDVVITEEAFEAPKDWAPKAPGGKGQLSEEFGLDDEREDIAAVTAAHR